MMALEPREAHGPSGGRAFLEAVLAATSDGILGLRPAGDDDASIAAANARAAELLGLPLDAALIGCSVRRLMPTLDGGGWARCRRIMEEGGRDEFELRCGLAGLDTWIRVTVAPLAGGGVVLSLTDVTKLKYAALEMELLRDEAQAAHADLALEIEARQIAEDELRRMAVTDGLTGVLNRRGFDEVVRNAAALAFRYGHPLAVIAVDIDHFKRLNDLYGHGAGDTVLMTVAATLAHELRKDTDSLARVGGEEFMVLLPHTPAAGAAILAERLRGALERMSIPVGEGAVSCTASFGVQEVHAAGSAERMLIEADQALYQAKRAGRNRVLVHSREVSEEAA